VGIAHQQITNQARHAARVLAIYGLREAVLAQWERQVRACVRGADELLTPILVNTLPDFFDHLAGALSRKDAAGNAPTSTNMPTVHGNERARMTGYGPEQVIQEYQIFRDCFAAVAHQAGVLLRRRDWDIINLSVDIGIRESIREFTAMHDGFQRRIAAGLSHDMRNPLSIISTSAQLLARQPDSERVTELAHKIGQYSKRLDTMIVELLDTLSYHRGQQLPLSLSEFDVMPLAHTVCSQVNLQHGDKCVVAGVPVVGWWCENYLRRALENLLGNAVKYGDDGQITVLIETDHGRMRACVHNSGQPIAPEQVCRIFDYLRRENQNATPGWGIGLPFVQSVAESHGGSVTVNSSADTGTTFTIDLPVDCRPFVKPAG